VQLPIPKIGFKSSRLDLSSVPLLPSSHPGRLASRNSTRLNSTQPFFVNHYARTMQKTQYLCCWEVMFLAPLNSNGSYYIVACVFIATGICLPRRCLTMNVYSDFSIPAFERNIKYETIYVPTIELPILFICFSSSRISIVENSYLKWFGI
jgi:hypothetical protein